MKQARTLRGDRTLFEVAKATGIEQSRLQRFETIDDRLLSYDALKALATYYECTIDDLLTRVPDVRATEEKVPA